MAGLNGIDAAALAVDECFIISYMKFMPSRPFARIVAPFAIAVAAAVFAAQASADTYNVGGIQIVNPWLRATPKGASVAGGYMTISNNGGTTDRLIGGSSAVAGRFEVHSMAMDQGIARMRPVEGGLEIKPGEAVHLKPGSFHVMLLGLKQPLEKGQRIKGTLEFEKAGKIDIEYQVEALGASSGPAGRHGH